MRILNALRWFFRDTSLGAQRARRAAKLLILIALFVILFWIVPIDQVVQAMLSADPFYLVLGIGLGICGTALTAVQMEPLTRNQGINLGVWAILEINLAVKFYLQFTPSTLIASGIRWYRLSQPDGKVVESLVALAFFRALETFLTLAMGLAFFLLAGQRANLEVSVSWVVLILIGIVLTWVLVTRYSLKLYQWFESRNQRFFEKKPWQAFTRRIEKFLTAVAAYARMPAFDLLLSITAGILSALLGIASGVYLAKAVGIDLDFLNMGWIQAVLLLATQLPFTVAGGLGVREVTLVAILSMFGISADLALALSFLLLIRGVVVSMLGGILEGIEAVRTRHSIQVNPSANDGKKL
jgi:uncharacterized protein (TIRG00374 family)